MLAQENQTVVVSEVLEVLVVQREERQLVATAARCHPCVVLGSRATSASGSRREACPRSCHLDVVGDDRAPADPDVENGPP